MPTNPTPTQQGETLEPNVHALTVLVCQDCIDLKGVACNNPQCVFCRRTMVEVQRYLDVMLLCPIVDGKRLILVGDAVTDEDTRRAAVAGPRGDVLTLIAQERQRQISVVGYDANHDDGDGHDAGELAQAAAAYALGGGQITNIFEDRTINIWPTSWGGEEDTIKRKPRIRQLVIAGALIVAEIERLQRADGDAAATSSPADNDAESLLQHVAYSGVEFDDNRMGYVVVQIDRDVWEQIKKLAPTTTKGDR